MSRHKGRQSIDLIRHSPDLGDGAVDVEREEGEFCEGDEGFAPLAVEDQGADGGEGEECAARAAVEGADALVEEGGVVVEEDGVAGEGRGVGDGEEGEGGTLGLWLVLVLGLRLRVLCGEGSGFQGLERGFRFVEVGGEVVG